MSGNFDEFNFSKNKPFNANISLLSQYMLFPNFSTSYQLLPISPNIILHDEFYAPLKEALDNTMNEQFYTLEYDEFIGYESINNKESTENKNTLFTLFKEELKELNSVSLYNNYFNDRCSKDYKQAKIICNPHNFFNMYNDFRYHQVIIKNDQFNIYFQSNEINYMKLIDYKTLPDNFNKEIIQNCDIDRFIVDFNVNNKCSTLLTDHYTLERFRSSFKFYFKKCYDFRSKMPNPDVDTTIIFNKTMKTTVLLYYDDHMHKAIYKKFGGDKTVPASSSLIPAFKWMYENKIKKTKNKIYLVDYCSSKYSKQHEYDDNKRKFQENQYYFINCEAGENGNSGNFDKSTHSFMIGDKFLIDYIKFKLLNLIHNDEKIDEPLTDLKSKYQSKNIKDIDFANENSIHNAFSVAYKIHLNYIRRDIVEVKDIRNNDIFKKKLLRKRNKEINN